MAWDTELINEGELVDAQRRAFTGQFHSRLSSIISEILPFNLKCIYLRGWKQDQSLPEALAGSWERDRATQATQVGPHRANLRLEAGGHALRPHVSRGHQQLLAAALVMIGKPAWLEKLLIALVLAMSLAFIGGLAVIEVDWRAVLAGFLPRLSADRLFPPLAPLRTAVGPHNLLLPASTQHHKHSAHDSCPRHSTPHNFQEPWPHSLPVRSPRPPRLAAVHPPPHPAALYFGTLIEPQDCTAGVNCGNPSIRVRAILIPPMCRRDRS